MYKLLLLTVLALLTVGTTGCFHNNCGTGWRPSSLFGSRQPTAAHRRNAANRFNVVIRAAVPRCPHR